MMKRIGLVAKKAVAISLGCVALSFGAAPKVLAAEKLNVLVIMSDELRPDHLGCGGSKVVKTPNIDKFAASGVFFEKAFTEMPISRPSRSATVTGRYPHVNGVRQNPWKLMDKETTLAEVMKAAGYKTAAIMTNGHADKGSGIEQGYEEFMFVGDPPGRRPAKAKQPGGEEPITPQPASEEDTPTYRATQSATAWLDKNHSAPFFLWVDYFDPHPPVNPPAPWDTMYDPTWKGHKGWKPLGKNPTEEAARHELTQYDGEVSFLDKYIGILLDKMQALNLLDKTMIVFLSDHGEMEGEHGLWGKMPCMYDPLTHFTLVMKYPGMPTAGKKINALVQSVDIVPTIFELTTVQPPRNLHGTSLVPLLKGEKEKVRDAVYSEFLDEKQLKAVRTTEWKYIYNFDDQTEELYRIADDPGELNNLADKEPQQLTKMRKMLLDWMIQTEDKSAERDSAREGPAPAQKG